MRKELQEVLVGSPGSLEEDSDPPKLMESPASEGRGLQPNPRPACCPLRHGLSRLRWWNLAIACHSFFFF